MMSEQHVAVCLAPNPSSNASVNEATNPATCTSKAVVDANHEIAVAVDTVVDAVQTCPNQDTDGNLARSTKVSQMTKAAPARYHSQPSHADSRDAHQTSR
jgi:hypothetical protein